LHPFTHGIVRGSRAASLPISHFKEEKMPLSISKIRGITPAHAANLKRHGLGNIDKYLDATKTPAMRRELAEKLHVEERMILEHANRCDLARIDGIGRSFSNLLENGGVDTVLELSKRTPENLQVKLVETNVGRRYSHRNPNLKEVRKWVAQAKRLPKMLVY
jgi:predicted flap endonuclease-1-like 5' DNA nuclease